MTNPRIKPHCEGLYKWLKLNLGRHALAPLTGTDMKALDAAVHIVHLYAYTGDREVLDAFRIVVERMQPSTRELAFHAIAYLRDWPDRPIMWAAAGLPLPAAVRRCAGEH